ncbi:MAG: response regulator [Candidatus Omnitrophica bacterium]|nr:response regulator [Candidatus Omnitrophota bacterium]MDD5771819.1 response regulator [Candidatus Omnitrophota bacterium]
MSKILIIDDDPMILKLYSEFLSKEGFEVLTASDADKGFELAVSRMPDLVLLDVMMPGVDGTQAHERFSKDPKTGSIKVAFLTALVKDEEVAASGGNIGGLEYISKSTPKEEFIRRVRGLLGANK